MSWNWHLWIWQKMAEGGLSSASLRRILAKEGYDNPNLTSEHFFHLASAFKPPQLKFIEKKSTSLFRTKRILCFTGEIRRNFILWTVEVTFNVKHPEVAPIFKLISKNLHQSSTKNPQLLLKDGSISEDYKNENWHSYSTPVHFVKV